MRIRDIFGQSVRSLLRHRGRTLLTVLGVIVGCCSVVIMISIGIGMRISTQATLSQMGDLTTITVNAMDEKGSAALDDAAAAQIAAIEHVAAVIPKMDYYGGVTLYAGAGRRYQADGPSLVGESPENARIEGYELTEGDWEKLKNGEVLIGQYLAYTFRDTKRPEGYNMINRYDYYNWEEDTCVGLPDPYVDPFNDTLTLVMGSSYETESTGSTNEVSIELKVGGILKEDWNKGYVTSEGIIMDIRTLQELKKKYARAAGTKQEADSGYTQILVKAESISDVEEIERQIKRLGFRTSSMESIRKPMEQEAQQKQMLLGGVGAVSLFVAALGIANTMIMAITERIREIGVMKALGCFVKDVRRMFLLEAGCIGLIGGIIGIGLSYLISRIMNQAGGGAMFGNDYDYLIDAASMKMSVIPWWLAVFAVFFSILVGVAAGLYPAEKAVRIPALEAIKHD